ncbi:MAG: ABC transporter substrate-binding protein [Chloroflexi bacterium]|nr:ABC transporter substrate-binding protein [Chloroflexota bacterium]
MKKTTLLLVLTLLALGLVISACAVPVAPAPAAPVAEAPAAEEPAEEEALVPIEFRLNWTLYGEHAPFYLGVDKGFYEEEGLDVSIIEGSGSATTVKLIGNGNNNLGYADSATMMNGVTAGVPVKAVAVTFQSSPMSFIYREDAARPTAIEELAGSRIAITAGDASMAIFNACLGANDLTMDDLEVIQVSNPQAKEVAVLEGKADAFLGYFVDQPMRMEKVTGVDIGWTPLPDICGVNTLSSAIIANNFWAEENPELVEKFVRASQRAWAYTQEHPEEAAEVFAEVAGDYGFDVPLSLAEILGSLTLLHTANSEGQPIGWSSADDWLATQKTLADFGGFKAEDDINVFFTNDFISESPYAPQ